MKDPETYLNELGVELPCAVVRGGQARIASRYSARVNHEIYYFSVPAARRKFLRDPREHCGLLTDPVTKVRFRPEETSPFVEHADRPYFFAADSTRTAFLAAAEMYAEPESRMIGAAADSAETGADSAAVPD